MRRQRFGLDLFFFFKQKSAYELYAGDWSSDVALPIFSQRSALGALGAIKPETCADRKSVVSGKRVDHGGRRISKKKKYFNVSSSYYL